MGRENEAKRKAKRRRRVTAPTSVSVSVQSDACECRYTGGNGGVGVVADGHCRRLRVQRVRRGSSAMKCDGAKVDTQYPGPEGSP
jgi:hypothetical protein